MEMIGCHTIFIVIDPNPSDEIVCQFDETPVKVRVGKEASAIFVSVSVGALEWMDAPFTPHLSDIGELPIPKEGQGYPFYLVLFDSTRRCIRKLRVIGLSAAISRGLRDLIIETAAEPFDLKRHQNDIRLTYGVWTSPQLAARARYAFNLE